jgi:hypothetical protein
MADELFELVRTLNPHLELKYNKFYIGLARNGQPNNFVIFRPQKAAIRVEPRLAKTEATESVVEAAGLDVMDYDTRWERYRIRLQKGGRQEARRRATSTTGGVLQGIRRRRRIAASN